MLNSPILHIQLDAQFHGVVKRGELPSGLLNPHVALEFEEVGVEPRMEALNELIDHHFVVVGIPELVTQIAEAITVGLRGLRRRLAAGLILVVELLMIVR
jgi:hypothetical protein